MLRWANNPVTRAAGFHPDPIDAASHAGWFAERLADDDGRLWIGELGGEPVGQVRADRDADGRVELGITVAPEWRGRGLARPLLLAGMAAAGRDLHAASFVAHVRPGNAPSLALFRGAGFTDAGTMDRGGIEGLVLISPARAGRPPAG